MGGSGGHMRHPHDLDEVETGKDIIALFRAIPDYLRTEEFTSGQGTSLKLDGSNNAIKVVQREDGKIQFAVDRGSHSPLDVNGVTLDKLKQRFTKVKKSGEVKFNDGLARSSAGLINMMQKTYDTNPERVEALLRNLTLIDENGIADPTKFINIEYIQRKEDDINSETGLGRANAIYYSFDSITFLNISQYYQIARKGVVKRPGAKRPTIKAYDDDGNLIDKVSTDVSVSIKFDPNVLDELVELCRKNAPLNATGVPYTILGPGDLGVRVDHELDDNASGKDIEAATQSAINQLQENIEHTLNSKLTIRISAERSVTKSLKDWLEMAVNFPYKPDITLVDGSKKGPFTKWMHDQLIDRQVPLDNIVPIGEEGCDFSGALDDCEKAVYGAIFYESARRLGNTIKQSLITKYDKFGNTVDQEGVVINAGMPFGDKTTSNVFKITGEFIVDGNKGVYAVRESSKDFLEQNFTVIISKNVKITKTINEWMSDAKANKHTFKKLPQMVYKDVLAGTPIIDIVIQGDAERTIYNAVMDYASNLKEQSEDTIELDIVADDAVATIEDEAGDPVVDVDAPGQTIALVPGAFKPPHRGHADMVRRYATGDGVEKADRTIILISNPEGAKRTLPHDGSEVSAEHSERIWETVFSDVTSLPGVEVRVADSDMRSPISIAYEYISETTPLDIRSGDNVILGASRKDRDYERWNGAAAWKKKKRGINVLAGEEYAVEPSERSDKKAFSASDSRQLISNLVNNPDDAESLRQLAEYIPQNKINQLFKILGQPSPVSNELEEMSAGSGGMNGYAAPFPGKRDKKKKNPNIVRRENKQTVDDVIRLLMERGIMS
jgi:hypothetical protein